MRPFVLWLCWPAAAWPETVSFHRDVAPVLAFHCNECHAAPPGTAAGGLSTASYAGLMAGGNTGRAVVAGDAERSLLVEYVDGRRARRMPLDAPPLSASEIETIRRWVAEGAREDPPAAEVVVERRGVAVRRGERLVVRCRAPSRAYLVLRVTGNRGRVLFAEERALKVGGEAAWSPVAGRDWPGRVDVRVGVRYFNGARDEIKLIVEDSRLRG